MSWMSFVSLVTLVTVLLPSAQQRRDPLPESFTATAQLLGEDCFAVAKLKIRVDRYPPDAESDAVLHALSRGGYAAFLTAVRKAPVVGSVEIAELSFEMRWARESAAKEGRSIVV